VFEGVLGRKVVRSALVGRNSGAAPELTPATKREKRGDRSADFELGEVGDETNATPKGGDGKKKRARRPG